MFTFKSSVFGLFLSLLLIAGCTSKALRNVEGSPIPANTKMEQVEKAIKAALIGKNWVVRESQPGKIVADIRVRQHYAKIQIDYDQNSYSIRHLESEMLNYNSSSQTIHRSFNRWIKNLDAIIQRNLSTNL